MLIIADTNILIAVLLDEPEANAIIEATLGHVIIAPYSVHFEVGNALVNAQRRGRRSAQELQAAFRSYEQMEIEYTDVDLAAAIQLASDTGLLAYDAYILLCAIENQASLLTLDRRLNAAAQLQGVKLLELSDERNSGT